MDKKTRLLERLRGDGRCCLATGVHPIFKAVTSNLKTKNKIKKYTYPHTHTKKKHHRSSMYLAPGKDTSLVKIVM